MRRHITQFQQFLTLRGLASSTIAELTRDLLTIAKHLPTPLSSINQEDLERTLLTLQASRSLKNVSLNRKISSLRLYFSFLHDRRYIPQNPTAALSFAKRIRTTPPAHLSVEQLQNLLSVSRVVPSHHTIIRTLYELALRPFELISLQIPDVDSSLMEIRVIGKGQKIRSIPFSHDLLVLLRNVVRTHTGYRHRGSLFTRHDGSLLTPSFLQNIIAHYANTAALHRRVTPRILRHTHATHALEAGVDLFRLKDTLGHSDLSTTMKYTHIARAAAHKAHEQFLSYALPSQAAP